jgi:molybdopterin-guanine dinucleotide biosynthesis protein A
MSGTLGVLLAGGRGLRLGRGIPKALVTVGGRTLLERALATLATLCDEVVVVAPADMALPVDAARRVDDPVPGAGALPAMVAGLSARPFTRALVLGVDLPFATPEALAALAAVPAEAPAVVPAPGGLAQPLAAWYSPGALGGLRDANERGVRALVAAVTALEPRLVTESELLALPGGSHAYFNLNTPEDLVAAERAINAGGRA